MVDNGAYRAVGNCLHETENELLLVKVRIRTAVVRPLVIDRAGIVGQEQTGQRFEGPALALFVL